MSLTVDDVRNLLVGQRNRNERTCVAIRGVDGHSRMIKLLEHLIDELIILGPEDPVPEHCLILTKPEVPDDDPE